MWKLVGLGFFALTCSGVVAARDASAGVLDKPAFTATPAELLAEAQAVAPAGAPLVHLRDNITITYDAAGRAERRYHVIVAFHSQARAEAWDGLTLRWRPSHQAQPVVRARVIDPNGNVVESDPARVRAEPVVVAPGVISDRHALDVPFPPAVAGGVLEEEIVYRDLAPRLAAGTSELFDYDPGSADANASTVITIDAPARHKLHVVARGFAQPPVLRRATAGGRSTWRYELGPWRAGQLEAGRAPDGLAAPLIGVSTAASWAAVATDYRRQVQGVLRARLALPAGLARGKDRAAVERIVAWLHAHVKPDGLSLRDTPIVPRSPAATIARGTGAVNDRAVLLVALLRAAGIRADLALVSTGAGPDVLPELPGIERFDRAIVRARVGRKDVWIDPAEADLAPGRLPAAAQGRRALVLAAGTRGLVTTPAAVAGDAGGAVRGDATP